MASVNILSTRVDHDYCFSEPIERQSHNILFQSNQSGDGPPMMSSDEESGSSTSSCDEAMPVCSSETPSRANSPATKNAAATNGNGKVEIGSCNRLKDPSFFNSKIRENESFPFQG